MMGARSGVVPRRLDAPVTATHFVRPSMRSITDCGSSSPVAGSNGASTWVAPARSQAMRHGVTLASWSRRVPTTLSPGRNVAPTARVKASVIVVMLAPRQMPRGSAPSNVASVSRVRDISESHASAAVKAPPELALLPLDAHSAIDAMATSTICVPAGPSKRDHPSRTPGKRWRRERTTMAAESVRSRGAPAAASTVLVAG